VREVRCGLERLAQTGFINLPEEDRLPEATPTEDERTIINESLLVHDYRFNTDLPATGWLAVHYLIREIGPRELAGFEERVARHRRLLDIVDVRRPVSAPEIIDIAYWLDYTIAATIDHYTRLYPDTADLSALPVDAATSTAECHRFEERTALITAWTEAHYGEREVTWAMAAGDIVRGAAISRQSVTTYLAALEPFRVLGAPLPVLSDAGREALADRPADRYDVAMLRAFDASGRRRTITEVGPLWLVQVAGRLGWTVAEARRRMARLEPLGLVVTCPPAHCPDEIVYWQDLLALTVHLDGEEPALSGPVGADHLAAAAADLEESVEAVRARLTRYTALFGFTLEPSALDTSKETIDV
jgi:hypothetical protein